MEGRCLIENSQGFSELSVARQEQEIFVKAYLAEPVGIDCVYSKVSFIANILSITGGNYSLLCIT